jgi:GTPase KRas protein
MGSVSIDFIDSQAHNSDMDLILFREGHVFVLVYSVASRSTSENVQIFHRSIQRVRRGDPIFILVGNKCDLTHQREVSREEGSALAEKYGCRFMETSARTAENVDTLFINLIRLLRLSRGMEQGTTVPLMQEKKQKSKSVIM